MAESEENIEDKVKNIISSKLKNGGQLAQNDIKTIEKLFELFPDLKKKFNGYINNNKNNMELTDESVIILDEIEIDKVTFYKDSRGGIWDTTADLVGIVNNKNNDQKYVFFDMKIDL